MPLPPEDELRELFACLPGEPQAARGLIRSRLRLASAALLSAASGRTRRRRTPALAAAALLLGTATAWVLWERGPLPATAPALLSPQGPQRTPQRLEASGGPRAFSPLPGTELLLASGALVRHVDAGLWRLERGACLVFSQGPELSLKAEGWEVRLSHGEAAVRLSGMAGMAKGIAEALLPDACAQESGIEVAVLSGTAILNVHGQEIALEALEAASAADGGASGPRVRALACGEPSSLRAAILASCTSGIPEERLLGAAERRPDGVLLDGRQAPSAWLGAALRAPYCATARLRLTADAPSVLGFCFEVDGKPSFWGVAPSSLRDGQWHDASVVVTPDWVILSLDDAASVRIPRPDFKPNPLQGVAGTGPVAWGGRMEVSGFSLASWWVPEGNHAGK